MIQCPICQVVNEETALFCAECGQRFGPAASEPPKMQGAPAQHLAPQAQPLSSLAEQEPKQKRVKLHSPILGGADAAEDEGYSKPQLSRLRGTAPGIGGGRPAPPPASEGRTTGGRKQLRSPLLGGADEDFEEEEEEKPVARSKPSPRKTGGGLRSPLLGEGSDFDDDDEPPAPRSAGTGKKKLRSPLLGEDDDDEDDYNPSQRGRKSRPFGGAAEPPRSSSASGGLRSPLLGGADDEPPSPMAPKSRSGGLRSPLLKGGDDYDDDDDDDQPSRPTPNRASKPGGRPKLHSPILGESDSYYDDDEDDEDDDGNPDVLRSPLLAAKKKRPAHPPQGQPTPGQMPGSQASMPHPAAYNPTQAQPQPPGQPGYGAPPAVPPGQPPSDLLVANQPGQTPPNYSQPGYSQQGLPGMPPPGMPQQPGIQTQQGIQPGVPPQFGMPPGMPPQPGMQPGQGANQDGGAPSAISQSGVQRYPNQASPPPAEPRDQVKLVSHTSSRSDVSALPSGADEKYAGLSELNKQLDKKEEVGPSDRRGTDRRKGGRDRRLTSPLVDGGRRYDDDDSDSMPAGKSGGVPAIVPILIIVGLLCKGLFFQQALPTLGGLPWYFWLDQAATGLALVLCLIIVVGSGGRK